jgi:hypothetical protein
VTFRNTNFCSSPKRAAYKDGDAFAWFALAWPLFFMIEELLLQERVLPPIGPAMVAMLIAVIWMLRVRAPRAPLVAA